MWKLISSIRAAIRNENGATAVEFAIISPIFLALLSGILYHSFVSLQLSHLDFAVFESASELKLRSTGITSVAKFKDSVVCPAAAPLLDCDKIRVGVDSSSDIREISKWREEDLIGKFCPGGPSDIVVVELKYEVVGPLRNFYLGMSKVEDEEILLSSRYLVTREPTILGEEVVC